MISSLPEQSSAGDWIESIQMLSVDDGAPCWTTIPDDLIVTMTVIPEGCSRSAITAKTTDAIGWLTAFTNGFLEISVPAASMGPLAPDRHGVAKRYLVFFKVEVSGYTLQFMVGVLPVTLGA